MSQLDNELDIQTDKSTKIIEEKKRREKKREIKWVV